MKKFVVSVILMCFSLTVLPLQVFAESSLESEFAAMKAQMQAMQEKMARMEEKIMEQERQLMVEKRTRKNYEDRVSELESSLENEHQHGHAKQASLKMPEIGVVVDSLLSLDSAKTDGEGADVLSIRELELVLGGDLDPYSRIDVGIAFSTDEDEAVSLEEAYLTRRQLFFDSTARVGKFKPLMGKVLAAHRSDLDTVDEPLVIQRYFTAEGMNKTGVDVSTKLGLPVPVTQELTVGVLDGGDDEAAFGGEKRRPSVYTHLKNHIDIGEKSGFELGGSYMAGSRDADSAMEVSILAADATFTHQLNADKKLKIQGEVFALERKESIDETTLADLDGRTWGAYGLVDLRVNPRWSVGSRYDYVQPIVTEEPAEGARNYDRAYSGYLTFYQSEFARWRAQFTHTDLGTGKDNNGVYLQGTFSIGTHKHAH